MDTTFIARISSFDRLRTNGTILFRATDTTFTKLSYEHYVERGEEVIMKGASPPSTPLLNDLFFDYKKATQALNFFALKEGGTINKMKALKLIYFADRYNLRKYGRPVRNDDYWAMGYGAAIRKRLE